MVFSSTIFLFGFLPVVLAAYFLAPRPVKNLTLLLASLLFYAWGETYYVLLMVASICSNFAFGLRIAAHGHTPRGKRAMAGGVAVNLLLLATFKYTNFIVDNLNVVLERVGVPALDVPQIHLPIGISFFTLQAISYIVDVYRGHARVQRNLIDLGLYISLFPQLIAGPIVRYEHIDRQLRSRTTTVDGFAEGVRRFVLGLGKKVLIANPLSVPADHIFALSGDELTPVLAWMGLFFYMLQVYFDFSGYSDMGIGLGRMLGFHFPENFNFPYISRSMREVWTRWHISLSTWLRDYLFFPLGGSQVGPARTYFNLFTVFFLCGLWHGANWTFIGFGIYHGVFLIIERQPFLAFLGNVWRPIQHLYVTLVWMLGIVFFRAVDIHHAYSYAKSAFGLADTGASWHTPSEVLTGEVLFVTPIAILCAIPLHEPILRAIERWKARGSEALAAAVEACRGAVTVVGLSAILVLCAVYLSATTHNPFIYFQF